MSSTEPSMAELGARPVDVPEDVLKMSWPSSTRSNRARELSPS